MLEYFRSLLPSARRTEDGASAVEYGLLVAGIAALVVAIVFVLGGFVKSGFKETCETIGAKDASTGTTSAQCSG